MQPTLHEFVNISQVLFESRDAAAVSEAGKQLEAIRSSVNAASLPNPTFSLSSYCFAAPGLVWFVFSAHTTHFFSSNETWVSTLSSYCSHLHGRLQTMRLISKYQRLHATLRLTHCAGRFVLECKVASMNAQHGTQKLPSQSLFSFFLSFVSMFSLDHAHAGAGARAHATGRLSSISQSFQRKCLVVCGMPSLHTSPISLAPATAS